MQESKKNSAATALNEAFCPKCGIKNAVYSILICGNNLNTEEPCAWGIPKVTVVIDDPDLDANSPDKRTQLSRII